MNNIMNIIIHIMNDDHTFTCINTSMEILHFCDTGQKMNTLEVYQIYIDCKRDKENIWNDQTQFQTDIIFVGVGCDRVVNGFI